MKIQGYLAKRTTIKNLDKRTNDTFDVAVLLNGEPITHIKKDRIAILEESVAYWQNAVHTHNWFKDRMNIEGNPSTRITIIPKEMLVDLEMTTSMVLEAVERNPGTHFSDIDECNLMPCEHAAIYIEELKYSNLVAKKLIEELDTEDRCHVEYSYTFVISE